MACLQAATEHLAGIVSPSDADVIALVIGDGRCPRTGALLAMRTKWTVLSVDPALDGLLPLGKEAAPVGDVAAAQLPKDAEAAPQRTAREAAAGGLTARSCPTCGTRCKVS